MFIPEPFFSAEDVRRIADNTGSYYFSDKTMKFWGSRLLTGFWPTNPTYTEGLIVVSNRDYSGEGRDYNVVRAEYFRVDGRVKLDLITVATLDTARQAKAWAKRKSEEVLAGGTRWESSDVA